MRERDENKNRQRVSVRSMNSSIVRWHVFCFRFNDSSFFPPAFPRKLCTLRIVAPVHNNDYTRTYAASKSNFVRDKTILHKYVILSCIVLCIIKKKKSTRISFAGKNRVHVRYLSLVSRAALYLSLYTPTNI